MKQPESGNEGGSPRGPAALAGAILLLAAGLRLWGLDSGLPNLQTRPDEIEVLQQTYRPASGQYHLDWSVYPNAYVYLTWLWGEAAVRTVGAPGTPSGAGYAEVYLHDAARVMLLQRVLSVAAGVATVAAVMLVAHRPLGDAAALGAGALLATSFLHVRDTHFVKPEALLGLAVIGALGAMASLAQRASVARGALAGLAVGAAMATKYTGIVLVVPAWFAAVAGSPERGWRRLASAPAAAAAGAAGAFFLATSPQLLFDPKTQAEVLHVVGLVFPNLFPQLLGDLARSGFEGPGPSPYSGPGALGGAIYHARFSLWFGAGKLVTLLAPLAVLWGFASRSALAKLAALTCVVWYAVIAASPANLARYVTPMLAPLLLLEAGLLDAATRRLVPRARRAAFAAAILALAAEPLAASVAHDRLLARTDTRVLATEWMTRYLPEGARVAVHGARFWYWGEPMLPPRAQRVYAPPEATALEQAGAGWLVVHEHPLFWSSPDERALAALAPRLALVARFAPYGAASRPVFETADAYYAPFAGFAGVERTGPEIRIYALRPAAE